MFTCKCFIPIETKMAQVKEFLWDECREFYFTCIHFNERFAKAEGKFILSDAEHA